MWGLIVDMLSSVEVCAIPCKACDGFGELGRLRVCNRRGGGGKVEGGCRVLEKLCIGFRFVRAFWLMYSQ